MKNKPFPTIGATSLVSNGQVQELLGFLGFVWESSLVSETIALCRRMTIPGGKEPMSLEKHLLTGQLLSDLNLLRSAF